jgi:hypothetical protein
MEEQIAYNDRMKKLFTSFLTFLSALIGRKKAPAAIPCEFCGETGHNTSDCPNAAKYKLFNVDRD